jgi:sugar porter (SP) family MFS transporter
VVSIYDVGCMVGTLCAAFFGYHLGRKKMIFIGCCISVVGAAIQACSYSVAQLIVGRIITGIGTGFNTGSVPTWVSETSKAKSRGKMVSTQLSIAAFGIVIAYWMNYGFFHLTGQIVWRFPVAFQAFFAIPTLLTLPFLPESPRFDYAKGRTAKADQTLAALKNAPVDSEIVQLEKQQILEAIELEDRLGTFSYKALFWDTSGQKIHIRMGLVIMIQALQELPGLNMVFYYSSFIFITIGIAQATALILGGVTSICFWLGSIAGIFLIDRIGRKNLLHLGTIPSLITYAVYIPMVKNGGQTQLWVAFAFTCVICFAYGYSWLPIPWVLGPELLPVRYRHIGAGLNAFSNWTFTFIIGKPLTPPFTLSTLTPRSQSRPHRPEKHWLETLHHFPGLYSLPTYFR